MDEKLYRKIRIINSWFIIVLMIGLFFCYYIPWFSIDETHPVQDNLYFNLNMMKKSADEEILGLSENIELLIISMWIMLIFALFSQLGLSIYTSPEYDTIGLLFILSGSLITVISSFLAFIFNYMIISGIQGLSASVYPSYVLPGLNYYYLPMISIIFLMILSVYYTLLVAPSCLTPLKKIEVEEDKEIWRKAAESQKQKLFLDPPDSEKLSKPSKDIKLPAGFQGDDLNNQVNQKTGFFDDDQNDFKKNSKDNISDDFINQSDYKQHKNDKSSFEEGKPFFDQDEKLSEKKEKDKESEFRGPVVDNETQKLKNEKIGSEKNDYDFSKKAKETENEYVDVTEDDVEDEGKAEGFEFEEEIDEKDDLKIEKTTEKNEQKYPQQKQVSVFGDSSGGKQELEKTKEVLHSSDDDKIENSDAFEKTFLTKFQKRLSERKQDKGSTDFSGEEKIVQNDNEEKQDQFKTEEPGIKSSFSKEQARAEIMKFLEENRDKAKNVDNKEPQRNDKDLKPDEKPENNSPVLETTAENINVTMEQTIEEKEQINEKYEEKKIPSEENIHDETVENVEDRTVDVLTVRCPKCKTEFDVNTNDDENVVQIKCPHCGESGVLKK
jgi:DNA-directed RNA polymerase subunit RPC12/RpoP